MKISAGMITKNAQEYIKYSIGSFIDYVDELIVVDDQSTDKTIDIAKSFGDKVQVVRGEYNGDKATQRNEYLKRATGDWIITPDADEVFYKKEIKKIHEIINSNKDIVFIAIQHINFWKDFCHTINGTSWDMIRHRIFKMRPDLRHRKLHYAVSFFDKKGREQLWHTYAVRTEKRYKIKNNFKLAHYGYCSPSNKVRQKIEYYMRRDNPNCHNEKRVQEYVERHPYFSGKMDNPRYGVDGLYCCGVHGGCKPDHIKRFEGEHPEIMQKHPQYVRLHDYIRNMNHYMENHWQFHNHLDHPRHQNRIKLAGKQCIGTVLDVGCADGKTTDIMQREYPDKKFSGAEPTDWGYKQAIKNYPNIKFYKDNGENLSVKDNSFDTVLLSEIIEHVYEPKLLMDEAWRVARKRVVITTPSQAHPDPDHKRFFSIEDMREFLKPYGEMKVTGLTRKGDLTDKDIYFMIAYVDK